MLYFYFLLCYCFALLAAFASLSLSLFLLAAFCALARTFALFAFAMHVCHTLPCVLCLARALQHFWLIGWLD